MSRITTRLKKALARVERSPATVALLGSPDQPIRGWLSGLYGIWFIGLEQLAYLAFGLSDSPVDAWPLLWAFFALGPITASNL